MTVALARLPHGSRRFRHAWVGGAALLTVLGGGAPVAHAQNASNQAAAEALFDQGKAAMAARRYSEACPKFFESNRLDEGIGTSLWLAECYEKNGQTASAWAQFREAAALAVKFNDPREKVARSRAQGLEAKLARLVLLVPAASRLPSLQIARDGGEVGAALWGTSVPTDPGPHSVVVSAPGHRSQTLTITIVPGPGEQALVIPVLAVAPPEVVAPPSRAVAGVTGLSAAAPGEPAPATKQSLQRPAAIAVGAAGLVSIAVASYFGLHAKSELNDSNSGGHCGAHDACDATGVADRSSAQSAATVSTVLFIVGGAALVGGGALWFTAPHATPARGSAFSPARVVPWFDARGGGVVLGADF